MKTKLRKIIINEATYLYAVADTYHPGTDTNTITLRIYLSGQKQTPLIIEFLCVNHYYVGQPLKAGIQLPNSAINTTDIVNLNEPKYIKSMILLGLKNGWTGTDTIATQNGLHYLNALGYDTTSLEIEKNTTNETPL